MDREISLPKLAEDYRLLSVRIANKEFGDEKFFGRSQNVIFSIYKMLNCINTDFKKSNLIAEGKTTSDIANEMILRPIRMGFVEILSSMEFNSKKQLEKTEKEYFKTLQEKQNNGKYIYLSDVINNSKDLENISLSDKKKWAFLIHIRNCLVHNRGISDKDFDSIIGSIEVKKDKGINGTILDFYELIETTVKLYSKLVLTF